MAKNFTQIKAAIVDWLNLDAVRLPDSVQGDIVNIVMRRVCRLHDLSYNEASDTFVTVANQRGYSLPATWSRPHTLWYLDTEVSSVVYLDYLSKQEFDAKYPDQTKTSKPEAYTVWGSELQLGKTPDRIITINRNYYEILADLVASSAETNRFTINAWEVLLFLSLVEATEYGIEDERVPMWQKKANDMLNELLIEHARAKSVGRKAVSEEPG